MLTDLFSHKIHSSGDEWQDKLVDIATIFSKFEGKEFDRNHIEEELKEISPRVSAASFAISRDESKFRDEISAYPAYLGLYRLHSEGGKWILRLSETAKRFLIVEEPNVPAFMILQLLLFQYPSGLGVRYNPNGNFVIQANARDRVLELIGEGVHVSPFRLICKALLADSQINGINSLHPRTTIDEVYVLANDPRTNQSASPDLNEVVSVIEEFRAGALSRITEAERRFHILNHTDFIQVTNGHIHLRETVSPEDHDSLIAKLNIINAVDVQYNGFDAATDSKKLSDAFRTGGWGDYFDAIVTLTAEVIQGLTDEVVAPVVSTVIAPTIDLDGDDIVVDNKAIQFTYRLRERDGSLNLETGPSRKTQVADPEVTRIKRQRSNLNHRILVHKMDELLRAKGATPYENEHIDLFAQIPGDGNFLFEMKSVSSENLLSQTRKGLSQLYEYRYRYKSDVGQDVTLCMVYPDEPNEIDWLQEYLCVDREVAVCWFSGETLKYSSFCTEKIKNLL